MIFRRYGTSYQSVDLDFDAKALNEVGFRRNRERAVPVDEFEAQYRTTETLELAEAASGPVQTETEQAMLDRLRARIDEALAGLTDGAVLVVENEQGHDWPKPRQLTTNVIEHGENKLHFDYTMAPPLRISVRQPTD
jgi:hypothetical protein